MSGSVKSNITFGLGVDEERYAAALEASALVSDIQMLPAGDATELGERGINLSGVAVLVMYRVGLGLLVDQQTSKTQITIMCVVLPAVLVPNQKPIYTNIVCQGQTPCTMVKHRWSKGTRGIGTCVVQWRQGGAVGRPPVCCGSTCGGYHFS